MQSWTISLHSTLVTECKGRGQTNTQTDIETYRLNRKKGQMSEYIAYTVSLKKSFGQKNAPHHKNTAGGHRIPVHNPPIAEIS